MVALLKLVVCFGCLFGLSLLAKDIAPASSALGLGRSIDDQPHQASVCQALGIVLLTRNDVRHELKFTDEQHEQVDEWLHTTWEQVQAHCPHVGSEEFESLSPEEREIRMDDIREFIHDAVDLAESQLGRVLNICQIERLYQLRLQREGKKALSRREIIERLELTNNQQQEIGELPCLANAPNSPPGAVTDGRSKLKAILTTDQWRQWTAIIGEDFTFPEMQKSELEIGIMHCVIGIDGQSRHRSHSSDSHLSDRQNHYAGYRL